MSEILLFHWGLEGGGSEVYRITEGVKERIVQRYSFMDFDENDDEVWRQGEIEHPSFEAFWQEAQMNPKWYYWHPVFINDDCKKIILSSINSIGASTIQDMDIDIIEDWRTLLNS
jgi:hypothetical protein